MSLDSGKLYRGFVRWFQLPDGVRTYEQAEQKLARVYHDYAMDAEDVSGERASNLDMQKFQQRLGFSRSRSERDFARQIEDAFVSYWTGTTFPILVVPPASPPCLNVGGTGEFSSEVSSQVTSVEALSMYNVILPIFRRSDNTATESARRLAEAMDRVTRSAIEVLITGWDTTPSPSGPIAITNTCTVF